MHAIQADEWSRGFASLAALVPRPRAVLSISAHWYTRGTFLTAEPRPRTIHDFYGFPAELYAVDYPAPGSPELAEDVRRRLSLPPAALRTDWGLDHGTWSVLRWMYPNADVPVVQLSIDADLEVERHFELARQLAQLRDHGVLVLGSGNITHNLGDALRRMRAGDETTPDWAQRFDLAVREALAEHDERRFLGLWPGTEDGRRSHPTGDHYLPVVYAFAASDRDDDVRFPVEGFDAGSLSMRCVLFG